jgi:hypothetical protein
MPALVDFFFVFTTVSALLTGYLLPRYVPGPTARRFGIGLCLAAGAFAMWSYAVITRQADALYTWMTLGLLFLLPALLFLIAAGTTGLSPRAQRLALAVGVGVSIVHVLLRMVYPSNPHFSDAGLFYFGEQTYVKFLTISLLTATVIPATLVLGREIGAKSVLAAKIFIGACVTELVGSVLLLASNEDALLFLVGWAMGIGFLLLLLVSLGTFRDTAQTGRTA